MGPRRDPNAVDIKYTILISWFTITKIVLYS